MHALLIYISEGQTFDPEKLRRNLEHIPGVSCIGGAEFSRYVVGCRYEFGGDSSDLRVEQDSPETIVIDGTGDASLNLALELQKREQRPLRVTDLSYSFDLPLWNIFSVDEFRRQRASAQAYGIGIRVAHTHDCAFQSEDLGGEGASGLSHPRSPHLISETR